LDGSRLPNARLGLLGAQRLARTQGFLVRYVAARGALRRHDDSA